jgi:hypothetical protein
MQGVRDEIRDHVPAVDDLGDLSVPQGQARARHRRLMAAVRELVPEYQEPRHGE